MALEQLELEAEAEAEAQEESDESEEREFAADDGVLLEKHNESA